MEEQYCRSLPPYARVYCCSIGVDLLDLERWGKGRHLPGKRNLARCRDKEGGRKVDNGRD